MTLGAFLFALAAVTDANENAIIVITSNQFPIHNNSLLNPELIQIFNLDDIGKVESDLSAGLPVNQKDAISEVNNRIKTMGKENVHQRFLAAYQPLVLALQLHITRVPAIIFYGGVVVYGVTDIGLAVTTYESWLVDRAAGDG